MNLQNNFTRTNRNLQEILEKCDKKILPFLPDCLDELAKKQELYKEKEGYILHRIC